MYQFKVNDPYFLPHLGCDVELELKKGQVLIITGANGVGKTSLLRRFFSSQTYSISFVEQGDLDYFYDRKLKKLKEVFLYSCKEDLDESLFLKIWNRFDLDKKEDRLQSSLSGGERQLLKLCLGLSIRSDIVMLDEPSQYLDDDYKLKLNEAIQDLLDLKKAVLMIEHQLNWKNFEATLIRLYQLNQILKIEKTWII